MKINKVKMLKAFGIGLVANLVIAGSASAQNQTGFEAVEDIQVSNNGLIRVDLSGPGLDPAGCGRDVYVIDPNQPTRNFWLAQLMTAKAAEQNVRIILNTTECANAGRNPRISVIVTE